MTTALLATFAVALVASVVLGSVIRRVSPSIVQVISSAEAAGTQKSGSAQTRLTYVRRIFM